LHWVLFNRVTVVGLAVAASVVLSLLIWGGLLTSGARAQVPPAGAAAEALATFSCGQSLRVVGRTDDSAGGFSTRFSSPQNVTGAGLNITVPPGTDCIFVTFSALMHTETDGGCNLRAVLNGVGMNPNLLRNGAFNNNGGEAVTYVWAQNVTVATQTTFLAQIQLSSAPAPKFCGVSQWTLMVERRD
jgi:hypothetical protein